MSIKLNSPIALSLEEAEIDDYVPSIKFNFVVNIEQFSNFLQYKGEIWINCNAWDKFLTDLISTEMTAILKDMNDSFLIQITKKHDHIEFLWSISREGVAKDIISASYKTKISGDVFFRIRDEFMNYPKWW